MKKISTLFLISVLLVLFSTTAQAAEFILGQPSVSTTSSSPVFSRVLSIGMTGQDVSALNKILGLEFNTTIASPNIFSADTVTYLKKLQERYTTQILIPSGLTDGTGIAGTATLAKLNTLAQQYNVQLSDFPAPAQQTTTTVAVPQIFTQTLSLGSFSDQVSLLKTVLNSDPLTTLVYTSTAEQGDPANLFDGATQLAVKKFQEKYAREILTPSGLVAGNGVVGAATRAKLNKILAGLSLGTGTKVGTVTPVITTTPTISAANTTINTYGITPGTYSGPYIGPLCTTDIWNCGDWGQCVSKDPTSTFGMQSRSCTKTYTCSNQGANHSAPTSQSCPIGAGSGIASGYVDACHISSKAECVITSGNATCNGNQIVCPAGTNLLETAASTKSNFIPGAQYLWCPLPSGTGIFTFLGEGITRTSYSCITPTTAATPQPKVGLATVIAIPDSDAYCSDRNSACNAICTHSEPIQAVSCGQGGCTFKVNGFSPVSPVGKSPYPSGQYGWGTYVTATPGGKCGNFQCSCGN